SEDRVLYVRLNLPVDDKFTDLASKVGETVYNAVDFENSQYNEVCIYLIKEDNEQEERARVFFRKNYNEYSLYSFGDEDKSKKDGYISTDMIFNGGKIDLVKEKIVDNIKKDKFYKQFPEDSVLIFDGDFNP
ncbi:MAG: hypothetical protein K6C14_08400, partial [Eubacterium sp.]|nr:hypothetical protein [Eubacterium sp.]